MTATEPRILLIEDDAAASALVSFALEREGRRVDAVADGRIGLDSALNQPFDLIIVDLMLPSLGGLEIVRALRERGRETPVLVLSALDAVDDRVRGLRAGADDYLGKPFDAEELSARVASLLRRHNASRMTTLRVADLEMDLIARRVTRAGRPIELTAREFRLLEVLMRHAGQVVTRRMLLESVWDIRFDPETNIIDVHVSRLRQSIHGEDGAALIHTVRGVGYVLRELAAESASGSGTASAGSGTATSESPASA